MTTAAGMQAISSDHHLHHHPHMLGGPFSPAFSFAASSVASAASKPGTDMSAWPHLNSSSAATSSNASRDRDGSSNNNNSNHRSPSASSSPSSNLTQAPSPPPSALVNSSGYTTAADVFDAPSSLTADQHHQLAAAASPSHDAAAATTPPPPPTSPPCHSPASSSPSRSPPPSASASCSAAPLPASSSQFLTHASPSVNGTQQLQLQLQRPSVSAPTFQFKPPSPYQAPGMDLQDVDAFLKDTQSSDMEQFLLELLQQPGPPTPASAPPPPPAAVNSPQQHHQHQPAVSRSSSSPSMRPLLRQQQQQQQPGSSYQTLMEMALDSNSSFMDSAAPPPATNSGASYMPLDGGVKPSFVVSHNSANFADASRPSTNSLYSNGGGTSCYMDTDSKDLLHYGNPHRTTFLEAMSTRTAASSSQQQQQQQQQQASDHWGSSTKPSEVDELEKEFMRIYGPNVNLRSSAASAASIRVKTEPHLMRSHSHSHDGAAGAAAPGPVKMESASFTSSMDHHHFDASEVAHSDTVMLELDPIPDSNPSVLTSQDMNQLMADAFVSSGMNHQPLDLSNNGNGLLHHHHHHHQHNQAAAAAMNANHYSAGLDIDPMMQAHLSAAGYYNTATGAGMHPQQQQQQQHKSNQLLDSCMSSSWPGGGGGGGGYKHYGQPLAQLKNNKMSVNFMAGQPTPNSSTMALVQAFASNSNAAGVGVGVGAGSHYHARRFLNSQSLPNLQQVTGAASSQPQLGNSNLGNSLAAHMGELTSSNCQLNRSNSLPSQRNAMGLMQQGHQGSPNQGSPLGGSPLGGSPLGNSPYLGHSVSFPAEHRGASPFLGPQHRIASSPSLQSLAGGAAANSYSNSLHTLHSQQQSLPQSPFASVNSSSLSQAPDFRGLQLGSLQHRPQHLYRPHNPNALLSNPDDLSSIMPNLSAPDPAAASHLTPVMMATGLQLVHLLIACAEAVADENMELAHVILERLSTLVLPLGNPMQRLAAYFAEALAARITRKNRGDLFRGLHGHKSIPKIEKIEAVSVLYDCVPTGKFGHLTANQVLLDAIETEQNVHLVDLHIWYGMQWPAFMQALASREGGPPNLRISAVGPSYEELKETGETLHECAKQLNVPLEYCPIVVPLEEFNVRLLEVRRGEVCVVNAFGQLHCLLHKGADNFNRILRGLRSLNPKVFALTENDGNHNSPIFLTRFMECLRYYSAVFDAFEASMPADSTARMKTEQLFAAQKIRNIIACEGTDRIERHETMIEWGKRMEAAGFTSVPLSGRAVSQAELLLNLYYSNGYTLANNNGYLALGWHTMPLIGVSAWR